MRWIVMKDYIKNGENYTDMWCILYATQEEAQAAKDKLETGYDKSWFDPAGNDEAGYSAFLYVDQIEL